VYRQIKILGRVVVFLNITMDDDSLSSSQQYSSSFIDVYNQELGNDFQQVFMPKPDTGNNNNTTKPRIPLLKLAQHEKEGRKNLPTQKEAINTMKDMLELNLMIQDNDRVQIVNELQQLTNITVPMNSAFYIQQLNNTIINQQETIQKMHTENFNLVMKYRQDECDLIIKYREEIEVLRGVNNRMREKEAELLENIRAMTSPPLTKEKQKKERLVKIVKEEKECYKWELLKNNNEKCVEIYGFSVQQIDTLVSVINDLYNPPKSTRGAKQTTDNWTRLLVVLYYQRYYQSLVYMCDKFDQSKTRLYDTINTYTNQIGPILFNYTLDEKGVDEQHDYHYMRHFIPTNKPIDTQKAATYYNKEKKSHGMYLHYIVDKNSGKATKYQVSIDTSHTMDEVAGVHTSQDCVCNYNERMIAKFMIMIIRFRGLLEDIEYMCQLTLALCNYDIDCGNPILESPILEIDG
jgi:hypothetical protein